MNEIITIKGIECYEENGVAYLKLEHAARGLGFTKTENKNGSEYVTVRWERVFGFLDEIGFDHKWSKNGFIPENIFYRLDVGQNRLFDLLRRDGYLVSRKGADRNTPTQRSMELGLMCIKETCVTHADGHTTVTRTPKITGKGQVYFLNRYRERI